MSNQDPELHDYYLNWTTQSLEEFAGLLATLNDGPEDADKLTEDMHAIAHNIKGMGSSFDFPLMTEIGTSLCRYLRSRKNGTPLAASLIEAHAKAMNVILANDIRGDGGDRGQALTARLNEIVDKELD